jgi:hypothetical protein
MRRVRSCPRVRRSPTPRPWVFSPRPLLRRHCWAAWPVGGSFCSSPTRAAWLRRECCCSSATGAKPSPGSSSSPRARPCSSRWLSRSSSPAGEDRRCPVFTSRCGTCLHAVCARPSKRASRMPSSRTSGSRRPSPASSGPGAFCFRRPLARGSRRDLALPGRARGVPPVSRRDVLRGSRLPLARRRLLHSERPARAGHGLLDRATGPRCSHDRGARGGTRALEAGARGGVRLAGSVAPALARGGRAWA